MVYQPLEELLPKANGSIYRLVRIASKRAAEIAATGHKLVPSSSIEKLTTTALKEIRAGQVVETSMAEKFGIKV